MSYINFIYFGNIFQTDNSRKDDMLIVAVAYILNRY